MKPHVVIIGLGNPGQSYEHTRHNLGFAATEQCARTWDSSSTWQDAPKFHARTCEVPYAGKTILLMQPQTYMNRSGECARKLVDFYKLDLLRQLIVMVDDIDLPLGTLRFREHGGPGTHNGMRSLVEHLGEGFPRLRLGVGTAPPGHELATWVLSKPLPEEQIIITQMLQQVPALLGPRLQA
jgi:PTH1 family peptidyl-tRNA hydrolase